MPFNSQFKVIEGQTFNPFEIISLAIKRTYSISSPLNDLHISMIFFFDPKLMIFRRCFSANWLSAYSALVIVIPWVVRLYVEIIHEL